MAQLFALEFYNSKAWKDLRNLLIIERGGKCERTGKVYIDTSKLVAHHKIELTPDNINDPSITLNPDNIEIISIDEHNKEHKRFGYTQGVYIVWGSPLSGKTTYVNQVSSYGDMIIDIDSIWQAVSGQDRYIKPNQLKANIFALRDCLYDQVRMRLGQWYDCYIIGGFANSIERNDLARRLGAECIYIDSTKDDCLQRAKKRPDEWIEYVNKWWEQYGRHNK